jgi:membrane protein DedA with SNARE-associated domain
MKHNDTIRRETALDLAAKHNISLLREFACESNMAAATCWLLFVLAIGTAVGTRVWGLSDMLTAGAGCLSIVMLVMAAANTARARDDWKAYKRAMNRDSWKG